MNHDAPAPPDESPLVGWLSGAGLLHLAPLLRAHAIDVDVLGSLSEADLVHIGLPLGDRKRLLQAWAQGPWQPPADAEGQRRQLTIVFADLVDSTAWCQALSPEAWRELVLGFQRAAVDVLQRHGGVVAQYLGDGVLAYFGYPQAREDAATRAVHAGLALVDAMERLPVPQALDGRTQLGVRVGIETGLVVMSAVGAVGEGGRREHLALGDVPHIAARLQALAPEQAVCIGDTTRALVGGQVVCEDLGVHPLKGVREPRRVWRVTGLSGSGLRFEDAGVGPRSPLVGRQHELAWLQSLWQGALKGQGQAVLLSGEAGIGKSRMVRELRARLGLAGVQAPMLQCSPWHVHAPLHPLREGLRRRLGFRAEQDAASQRAQLLALAAGQGLSAAQTQALATLLFVDEGGQPWSGSPRDREDALIDALVALVERRAWRLPLLLVIEDAHWADAGTVRFMQALVERLAGWPMLLLVTHRPGFQAPFDGQRAVAALKVPTLQRHEVQQLVQSLVGASAVPDGWRSIVERADGMPLYAEELARAAAGAQADASAIPVTLQDSLMARLDRLPRARELAQLMAVIGREVDAEFVATVMNRPQASVAPDLAALAAAAVLHEDAAPHGRRYAFRHALLQDAALQSLLAPRRRAWHEQVARALVAHAASRSEEVDPAEVARHADGAGLDEWAARWWRQAAERALTRRSIEEAMTHLQAGLLSAERLPAGPERDRCEMELRAMLGTAHMLSRGWAAPEVEQAYARAQALADRGDHVAEAIWPLWGNCVFHLVRGDVRLAQGIGQRITTVARQADSRLAWLVHDMLHLQLAFYSGQVAEVPTWAERVEHRFQDPADRSLIALYSTDLLLVARVHAMHAAWLTGVDDQGAAGPGHDAAWAQVLARANELHHPYSLAWALSWGAMIHVHRRDPERVEACARQAEALARENGHAYACAMAHVMQAWARAQGRLLAGQLPEAKAALVDMQDAIGLFRDTGAGIVVPFFLTLLAEAQAECGQAAAGIGHVDEALRLSEAGGEHWYQAESLRVRAALLAMLPGRLPEAHRVLDEAQALAQSQSAGRWVRHCQATRAQLLAASG